MPVLRDGIEAASIDLSVARRMVQRLSENGLKSMSEANGKIKGGPLSTHVMNSANAFRLLAEGWYARAIRAFWPARREHSSSAERSFTP
jgi:hypothetical protein